MNKREAMGNVTQILEGKSMNYYSFHIGDYRRDTIYLSMLEHGAYRQLLDWCYLNESPIPKETEVVFRRLSARTEEEKKAILTVLGEMFIDTPEGYIQKRVLREISEYQGKAQRARDNGKLGGRPKKTDMVISHNPELTQEKANHKPITTNHKPITINHSIPPLYFPQGKKSPTAILPSSAMHANKNPKEKVKAFRGMRLAKDWVLPKAWEEWALAQNPRWGEENIRKIADSFTDYWHAKAGANAIKMDWEATWRNWIRKEISAIRPFAEKPSLYAQNMAAADRAYERLKAKEEARCN